MIIIQVILLFDSVYDSSGIVAPSKLSVQQSYSAHGSFVERGSLGAEEGVVVDSAEFRKLIVEDDLYRLKISNGKQSIVASVRAVSGVGWLLFQRWCLVWLSASTIWVYNGMVVRMF